MTTPGTQYALFESVEALPVEQSVQTTAARRFSDYVVYVDESGDHSLASIDKDYPVFVSNSHFDFLMGSEAGFRSRNFQTWSYASQMEPDCLGQTGGGPLC